MSDDEKREGLMSRALRRSSSYGAASVAREAPADNHSAWAIVVKMKTSMPFGITDGLVANLTLDVLVSLIKNGNHPRDRRNADRLSQAVTVIYPVE